MIIEQSFLHLPEILHGSGYQLQDYEAGIVGALSLAILQVLNGRNVANPISCLQHERLFRESGIYEGVDNPRYLRSDLFVNTGKLYVANRRLAQYGWRHNNWLEAKFLRNQTDSGKKHSSNKTAHVASFLADLIRLATLVDEKAKQSAQGRYFLHVYDSDPAKYLTFRKRRWLKMLTENGPQELTIDKLKDESPTVKKLAGDFAGLKLNLKVNNYSILPLQIDSMPAYWMYLTRIDGVEISLGDLNWKLHTNRKIFGNRNDLGEIAKHVVETINIDPKSSETGPPAEVEEGEEIDEDEELEEELQAAEEPDSSNMGEEQ